MYGCQNICAVFERNRAWGVGQETMMRRDPTAHFSLCISQRPTDQRRAPCKGCPAVFQQGSPASPFGLRAARRQPQGAHRPSILHPRLPLPNGPGSAPRGAAGGDGRQQSGTVMCPVIIRLARMCRAQNQAAGVRRQGAGNNYHDTVTRKHKAKLFTILITVYPCLWLHMAVGLAA